MNVVGQMRRVLKSEWGMRKRAVRIIYKGLFVACVLYGASVWCDMIKYEYARVLLNRCQRMVLYACLNVSNRFDGQHANFDGCATLGP